LSLAARDRRVVALNAAERTRAAWAARGGLETARGRLERLLQETAAANPDPWWNPQHFLPDTVRQDDAAWYLLARDANARLNLNRAGEEDLRRLFAALRVDATRADSLAQAIADWRDADDLHRARGAEREAYLKSGAPTLPRNGPFRSVAELLDVRGITPAQLLSSSARALLQAHFAELAAQATFEIRELELVSTGWSGDGRVRVTASGLLVRARETAFLISPP
jgi:type II secretory pathway component PulK